MSNPTEFDHALTLIRMAGGGGMTPETLNRNNSKWFEVKLFFIQDLLLPKCEREEGSHRESSLLPIGCLEVIYVSRPHDYALFTAIRISVNGQVCRIIDHRAGSDNLHLKACPSLRKY
jgi:hypothetical protein